MDNINWEKLTKTFSALTERELEEELIILKKERSEWQGKQTAEKRYMLPSVKFCEEKVYEYNVKINVVNSVLYRKIENGKWYNKLKAKIENAPYVKYTLSILGVSLFISTFFGLSGYAGYGYSFFNSLVNLIFVELPIIILLLVISEAAKVFTEEFSFDKKSGIVQFLLGLFYLGGGLLLFLGWGVLSFSLGTFSIFG